MVTMNSAAPSRPYGCYSNHEPKSLFTSLAASANGFITAVSLQMVNVRFHTTGISLLRVQMWRYLQRRLAHEFVWSGSGEDGQCWSTHGEQTLKLVPYLNA